jgi:hypothetical protein
VAEKETVMRSSFGMIVVLLAFAAAPASAQQGYGTVARVSGSPPPESDFGMRITPYYWNTAAHGSITAKGNPGDVSISYGDALSDTDYGLSLHLEAESGAFSLFGDFNYVRFEDDKGGGNESEMRQGIYEFGGAFTLFDEQFARGKTNRLRLDALGGLRVHEMSMEVDTPGLDFSSHRDFGDLFFGARARYELGDWLWIFLRGDAGIGESDGAWNAIGGFDFKFTPHFAVEAGYRWYSVNFDEGSRPNQFVYNVLLQGPFLGMTFSF